MVASEERTIPGKVCPIFNVLARPSLHIFEPLSLKLRQNRISRFQIYKEIYNTDINKSKPFRVILTKLPQTYARGDLNRFFCFKFRFIRVATISFIRWVTVSCLGMLLLRPLAHFFCNVLSRLLECRYVSRE